MNESTATMNGDASPLTADNIKVVYGDGTESSDGFNYEIGRLALEQLNKNFYKYAENQIIDDFQAYIDNTYAGHYKTENRNIECFDAWIALGDSTPTFRNTAIKYLWRYGKKNGSSKADLMKALHYTLMCLYVDHYKDFK
jgi:hypothetical protein